ncbi:aminotransferase class V-fold PLP-dependent enzyme [Escherichia coli]
MIATVSLSEGTTWTKAPWRFEAGTPRPVSSVSGAALEYVSALGLNSIAEYEQNLMHYALSQLESVPIVTLYGPQTGSASSLLISVHDAYDVGSFLIITALLGEQWHITATHLAYYVL